MTLPFLVTPCIAWLTKLETLCVSLVCIQYRVNGITNNLEGLVLDHRYYAGACSPHYIMDTRFRKPYNVESYTPEVSLRLINANK